MTDPKDPTEAISPWSEPNPATPATPAPAPTPAPPGTSVLPPTPSYDVPAAALTAVRPAPRRRRGLVDVVLVVATIFAVGGVGFAVGRVTATTTAAVAPGPGNGQFQGNGQFPGGGTGPNGSPLPGGGQGGFGLGGGITISGEVVDVAADHLTLKLANGQSVEIGLSSTTTYHSQAAATAADVTPGSTVEVQVGRAGGTGGTGGTGGVANGGAFGSASDVTVVPK